MVHSDLPHQLLCIVDNSPVLAVHQRVQQLHQRNLLFLLLYGLPVLKQPVRAPVLTNIALLLWVILPVWLHRWHFLDV